jgi:SAM-dependent methyltransferase
MAHERVPAIADSTYVPGQVYLSPDVADAWRHNEARVNRRLAAATELMLDLAGVATGSRVLDVGAGTGGQTLVAAHRVGPNGHVLATDLAETMLLHAADAVQAAGLTNVETRVMDAEQIDLPPDSFDAAISRLAIMLIPDRHAALTGIHRALKAGGKLSALVHCSMERSPAYGIPVRAVIRRGLLVPSPDRPGMFSLGDPDAFAGLLRTAGFKDVAVHTVDTPVMFASLAEAVDHLRNAPLIRRPTAGLTDAERDDLWAEIAQELRQFGGPGGFAAPGEVLVGVGTK